MKYTHEDGTPFTKEEFLQKLKTDREFKDEFGNKGIDQISDLIKQLKENPDSRRLLVSAWNVEDVQNGSMILPPCHYSFQVHTRELSLNERGEVFRKTYPGKSVDDFAPGGMEVQSLRSQLESRYNKANIPTRAISLMFNMRSVDVPLGLPFNIASYGLLLEIIAKIVNMVPDELIANLGDTHIYTNQIDGVKEQIGRELSLKERLDLFAEFFDITPGSEDMIESEIHSALSESNIPTRTRCPYPLPALNINTEFWPTESGECGIGPIDALAVLRGFSDDNFCKCLLEDDIQLSNYRYHPTIQMPLSN
jgi:thymidylate synthase